jgi:hypothetical protein
MGTKENLQKLKNERVKEILKDKSLSKIEKLRTIEEERLWGYADWVQNEFEDWEKEAKSLYKKLKGQGSCVSDTIFNDGERYSNMSYADLLEYLGEDYEDEDEEVKDPLITVVTTRGEPYVEIKKPLSEVIDVVFKFAVKNKIIGFKNDW